MLYLEDYLESMNTNNADVKRPSQFIVLIYCVLLVIEHLPQELRDRFTEMRELDLAVQSK